MAPLCSFSVYKKEEKIQFGMGWYNLVGQGNFEEKNPEEVNI